MSTVVIPYNFEPRTYQLPIMKAIDSGYKRIIAAYHRRAGKDKTLFNIVIKKAFERVGVYYYFFPEFAQGRRVIWDGFDGSGMKFRDHIPQELIVRENSTNMHIELINGSIIQIVGTDKFNKIRGANPIGCVFSEYAFQNPAAWDVVRPILLENGGWAVFNSTPFGKNHFYKLFRMAEANNEWFTQLVTVDDSLDLEGKPYITKEMIDQERISGMSEEMIQQEFYCSFTANSEGFYYLRYMEDLNKNGQITDIIPDLTTVVDTWWDIGVGDATVIWFTQMINNQIKVIDYYKNNTYGLDHYAKYLQNKPYIYNTHNFPHDMANTEFGTGRTRLEVAEELFKGQRINIVPKIGLEDGINAVRMVLPHCYFDKERCDHGISALENYHREYDNVRREFKNKPVHDWSSHPADAFRYFAVGLTLPKTKSLRQKMISRFSRFGKSQNNWMSA